MTSHLRLAWPLLALVAVLAATIPSSVLAISTEQFYKEGEDIFDDWDLCRTRAEGEDGFFQVRSETSFRPIIVGESLGANADMAYRIGQQFARDYPDIHQRAENVFAFARDKIRYSSDASQFGFPEFAQNADEMTTTIDEEGSARGDCEDYAILLAVLYKGAGLRSAIVLASDHAATLVHLPGYEGANQSLSIGDEAGWVWGEATGGNNPLGWMPESYIGAQLAAYEVEDEATEAAGPPDKATTVVTKGSGGGGFGIPPFFIVMAMMWLLSLSRRRRARVRR
jgi:hypothetical protein